MVSGELFSVRRDGGEQWDGENKTDTTHGITPVFGAYC